jgi:hypothetical protein
MLRIMDLFVMPCNSLDCHQLVFLVSVLSQDCILEVRIVKNVTTHIQRYHIELYLVKVIYSDNELHLALKLDVQVLIHAKSTQEIGLRMWL